MPRYAASAKAGRAPAGPPLGAFRYSSLGLMPSCPAAARRPLP